MSTPAAAAAAATARALLTTFKASEIRHLAFLAGLEVSATKTHLVARLPELLAVARLPDDVPSPPAAPAPAPGTLRILSIDMGIRNLAYCVLDVPASSLTSISTSTSTSTSTSREAAPDAEPKKKDKSKQRAKTTPFTALVAPFLPAHPGTQLPAALTLHAWQRTTITASSLLARPSSTSSSSSSSSAALPPAATAAAEPGTTTTTTTEAFDAPLYARLAYALVRGVLLPHAAHVVLIERQRYRSAGSPAILDWTVRVNMFESMLHSVFETLRGEEAREVVDGVPDGRGHGAVIPSVFPVDPKKVGGFWTTSAPGVELEEAGDLARREIKNKAKAMKEAKMVVAENWLRGTGLRCGREAKGTRRAFLAGRGRKRGGGSREKVAAQEEDGGDDDEDEEHEVKKRAAVTGDPDAKLSKLDDLADCLLQGVAWVQWEVNRRRILKLLESHDSGRVIEDMKAKKLEKPVRKKKSKM